MDAPSATTTTADTTAAAPATTDPGVAPPPSSRQPSPQPLPRDLAGVIGYADTLAADNRLHEAIEIYRNVLRRHPRILGLHFNLGVALLRHERPRDAVRHFDTLLNAADCPDWLLLRGRQALALALEQSGETAAAAAEYRRLLALEPGNFAVQRQLATLYRDLALPERALDAYQRCHQLWPRHAGVALEIVQLQRRLLDWDALPGEAGQLALMQAGQQAVEGVEPPAPHALLQLPLARQDEGREGAVAVVARAHARFIEQACGAPSLPERVAAPRAGRRLRLAYATHDVHGPHAAWLRTLLRCHDRERFELVLYTWGPDDGSAEREQARLDAEHAIDVAGWSDPLVTQRMRLDQIDVLLNPGCAAPQSRPGLFARRPAPLQVAWLGDPLSAWSGWYDALIGDAVQRGPLDEAPRARPAPDGRPAGSVARLDDPYPSPLILLPGSARLLPEDAPSTVEPLGRRALGLPDRAPVLALLCEPEAIDAAFFDMGLRLAGLVPGSALWLRDPGTRARARLQDRCARLQVPSSCLVFLPVTPLHALRARLRHADLVLDPGTTEGGTLALDALAAGVPTLTLRGQHSAHRIAASLMEAAGAPEAVSDTLADYEARARHLLQHPRELLAWRRYLAHAAALANHIDPDTRTTCPPLWTPRATAQALEAAIDQLWHERHGA